MRTTDESIDKAAGLRFKRSPPARIRMDTSVMISLSLRLFYLFIFFYPIAVYIVEFYNVLRKKEYPWFYSTVHKFQIIFPFSSLFVHCLRFTMKTITPFVLFRSCFLCTKGEEKKNHFHETSHCTRRASNSLN